MLDPVILATMMRRAGARAAQVRAAMPAVMLAVEGYYLRLCPDLRDKHCPGVEPLLARLARRNILLALVTGNLTRIGWRKLERAGLRDYFRFGAFGEMAGTRAGEAGHPPGAARETDRARRADFARRRRARGRDRGAGQWHSRDLCRDRAHVRGRVAARAPAHIVEGPPRAASVDGGDSAGGRREFHRGAAEAQRGGAERLTETGGRREALAARSPARRAHGRGRVAARAPAHIVERLRLFRQLLFFFSASLR